MLREAGKNADVLITAVGRANFLTRDLTGEDQIILDVGINDDGAGGICGDVDPQAASAAAAAQPGAGRCRQRDHRRSHGSRGNEQQREALCRKNKRNRKR